MAKRKDILKPFILSIVIILLTYYLMGLIYPVIEENNYIPSFVEVLESASRNDISGRLQWMISDITEATFHGAVLPSIIILLFGIVGNEMEKRGYVFLDIPIMGGSGLFWPVILNSILALIISNILYFNGEWSPTFTAYVSIAPILTQIFEHDFYQSMTIIILAGIGNFPLSNLIYKKIAIPLNIPGFAGVAIGMAVMVVIAIEVCNILPWMKKRDEEEKNVAENVEYKKNENKSEYKFFFSRLLADPGEAYNWGTPFSVIGLLLGSLTSWVLNPESVNYGSGRFPILFIGGLLTGAIAIFLWYPKYKTSGFAFTFTSVICANSVFNTYDLSIIGIIGTILVSVTIVPLLVHFLLENINITDRWHPAPIAQISLGLISALWSLMIINIPIFLK